MIMARAKRCPFCGHKLDAEGWCRNTKCADYIRTQTHDAEKAAEAVRREQVKSCGNRAKLQ